MASRKMVQMNLLQGRSRDADAEKRLDVGGGEGGMNWELGTNICT